MARLALFRLFLRHPFVLTVGVFVLLGSGCAVQNAFDLLPGGKDRPAYAHNELNVLAIGDWGRNGLYNQRDVALRLGIEADRDSSRFVISTGDNFYESGVESVTDPQWQRSFEDIYTAPSLQVPWYVVLGNHDYRGNVQAQIDYSERSERWRMPSAYFTVEKEVDDTTQALFVYLDTTPLTYDVISQAEMASRASSAAQQLRWLDSTLTESSASWRIVIGHHPLFAVGAEHQDDPVLIQNLQSLLEKHKVQAYISGHAHNLEHLRPEGTVDYFISGAGSEVRRVYPNNMTRFAASVPGFMALSLSAKRMQVEFIDFQGSLQYQTDIEQAR